jgi:hypothetical protein
MGKAGATKTRSNYKAYIWAGIAVWLVSAVLFALNTGPFVARPLQVAALIGLALLVYGLIQWWRTRRR